MSAVDTQFYKKKNTTTFYVAISFLSLAILTTIALYLYVGKIESENIETQTSISQIDDWIQAIQEDELVEVYRIYEKHKVFLETLSSRSQIPGIISHLKKNFAKYNVDAKGFNYSEWIVSLKLSAQKDDSGFAYEKVVKFLREYPNDENARFDIKPISSFIWYDRINYSAEFVLK